MAVFGRNAQHGFSRSIDNGDDAVGVNADDPRRHALKHGFGEAAALVDQILGGQAARCAAT